MGQSHYLLVEVLVLQEGSHVRVVVLGADRVQLKQRLVVVLLERENGLQMEGYGRFSGTYGR